MDADLVFAENLRIAREHAGLSQTSLAKRLTREGLAFRQSTIWKIESGSRRVTIGEAAHLAELLDVELSELLRPDFVPRPSMREALAIVREVDGSDQTDGTRESRRIELAYAVIEAGV